MVSLSRLHELVGLNIVSTLTCGGCVCTICVCKHTNAYSVNQRTQYEDSVVGCGSLVRSNGAPVIVANDLGVV